MNEGYYDAECAIFNQIIVMEVVQMLKWGGELWWFMRFRIKLHRGFVLLSAFAVTDALSGYFACPGHLCGNDSGHMDIHGCMFEASTYTYLVSNFWHCGILTVSYRRSLKEICLRPWMGSWTCYNTIYPEAKSLCEFIQWLKVSIFICELRELFKTRLKCQAPKYIQSHLTSSC